MSSYFEKWLYYVVLQFFGLWSEKYIPIRLSEKEVGIIANTVKIIRQEKQNPDVFNVGLNINEAGRQTILHCHIYIIPRYKGDVENPRAGIRAVILSKKEY